MSISRTRVLYISNIEVPYRTRFFNLLGERVDLTVLYERKQSLNRDSEWTKSEKSLYRKEYLSGISIGNERSFSPSIIKHVFGNYDRVVIGCINTPTQMLAILVMKILHKSYYVNIDGKMFDTGNYIKRKARRFFVRGAKGYFCAGIKASDGLKKFIGDDKPIYTYLFSSLVENERLGIERNPIKERNGQILVVGQYENYKGLDIAAEVAKNTPKFEYVFVGMGKKAKAFTEYLKNKGIENVKVIPFLDKKELEKMYRTCGMLVLPSRQECWGLVVNEAAAQGMPIVSTWGSGAAEEFLSPEYEQYLAAPDNVEELEKCVRNLAESDEVERERYSKYLFDKSRAYVIDENVDSFVKGIEDR